MSFAVVEACSSSTTMLVMLSPEPPSVSAPISAMKSAPIPSGERSMKVRSPVKVWVTLSTRKSRSAIWKSSVTFIVSKTARGRPSGMARSGVVSLV